MVGMWFKQSVQCVGIRGASMRRDYECVLSKEVEKAILSRRPQIISQ